MQNLLHRLVGQIGKWPVPARVASLGDPLLDLGLERVGRHAGEGGSEDLFKLLHRKPGDGLAVARQDRLERAQHPSSGASSPPAWGPDPGNKYINIFAMSA